MGERGTRETGVRRPEVSRHRTGAHGLAAHEAVATLNPGYFALVMGAGIVFIGVRPHGLIALSAALMGVAAVGYVVLVVLTCWRAAACCARCCVPVAGRRNRCRDSGYADAWPDRGGQHQPALD